jgi:hypothetical protein
MGDARAQKRLTKKKHYRQTSIAHQKMWGGGDKNKV